MTSPDASSSRCEHLLQGPQHREDGLRIQLPERFEQALSIDRAQLIQGNEAGAALEAAPRPPRIRATPGRHGCDDHGPEMLVQFVRRYDDAGSRLLYFTAQRGVESNQVDVPAANRALPYRHSHSSRSNLVVVGSSRSRSSERLRIRCAAAAHALRAWRTPSTTN